MPQQVVQGIVGDADRGQRAHVGMILDRNAQRAGMQDEGFVVAMPAVEDKGQGLALLRRLAFHVEELRGVGDRLANDDEAIRSEAQTSEPQSLLRNQYDVL